MGDRTWAIPLRRQTSTPTTTSVHLLTVEKLLTYRSPTSDPSTKRHIHCLNPSPMQSRVTDFWPLARSTQTALQLESNTRNAVAPPRVTLMDLPKHIRRRIYRYIGLLPSVSSRFIHLGKTSPYNKRCLFASVDRDSHSRVESDSEAEGYDHRSEGHLDSDHSIGYDVQEFPNCHLCPPSVWYDSSRTLRHRGPWFYPTSPELRRVSSVWTIGWLMQPSEVVCPRCHVGPEPHSCRVPTNLFRVCRAWSEDAIQIFYSKNKFKSFHLPDKGFAVLDSLRPSTLRAVRRLTVRLSMSFCHVVSEGKQCSLQYHNWECHPGKVCLLTNLVDISFPNANPGGQDCKVLGHDGPLEAKQGRYKQVMGDWQRLCQRLSVTIEPGRLNLTLIANTEDIDVATALVEPMRSLPALRSCSISLSKWHNPEIRSVAEMTCLRAIGYPESRFRDPFPFRQLPDEIQLNILRHTGLKAPYHLWFDRVRPGHTSYCDKAISSQCIYKPDSIEKDGCIMCCTGDHAHSAANPTCSCWTLSLTPFRVDRKMRHMAQSILFQENTWILDLGEVECIPEGHAFSCLDDLLRLARNLQLRVSTNDAGQPYYVPGQRWHDLIQRLTKLHFDPSQLTMSLIMLHPLHEGREPVDSHVFHEDSDDDAAEWSGHRSFSSRAYQSFQFHKFRPKDLFVRILRRHHVYGIGDNTWQMTTHDESPTCDQRDFAAQETEIERHILGDALYDASARGKSKAIHEMADDRPKNRTKWDSRKCVNVWKPFSLEADCSQCGGFSNDHCVRKL